ncbi:hypothetical protein [Clostridium sp. HBUAS56010]|uniref:hypothetical protein n=1 Tax=Clostridium sp. HBUAS56010 TaxID=2571127 RepID=UPI001FAA2589|nr:hypothetical protein [Clostridium sp. HBUAS56010]
MKFQNEALEEFDVKPVTSQEMDIAINQCMNVYQNRPHWLSTKNDVRTIGFGKALCEETARLATLAIHVTIDGSPRAEWLQQQIDKRYFKFREWLEYGCAAGTFILKPNGKGIDFLLPNSFQIVDADDDGNVTGVIFADQYTESGILSKQKYYTKFEYHRFIENTGEYLISNRTYMSTSEGEKGRAVPIEDTKWAGLESDVSLMTAEGKSLDRMLFGIFRTPQANNLDINSPLGLPIFQNVLEELKSLDTAYSRNSEEIKESRRMVLADDRLFLPSGEKLGRKGLWESIKGLPHFIKNVFGQGEKEFYQEINPQLNTEIRIKGFNNELSILGYKVGFSSGYFVLDQKTGMVTATQVESDDRRTIQFIKDVRDKLEDCMDGLIYALNVFADLYGLAPAGTYETTYDFGDITYNREEDRARWWQYVVQGKVPAWLYYQKFEGMSEEEAKAMIAEAKADQEAPELFGEE